MPLSLSDPSLPSLAATAAALRKATEFLALELANPRDRAPDWDDAQWRIALAVAAMHGISPLLATASGWQGPAQWRQFLDAQRLHTLQRHRRIILLLAKIDTAARTAGIPIISLKGAALHGLGLYKPGERPMADIDLLVDPGDVAATQRLLASLGFEETYATRRERTFMPANAPAPLGFGEHICNAVKIELHSKIAEPLPLSETAITALLMTDGVRPGINPYPSNAALMTHLLLHAAGNMRIRALRLIHVHDIALLAHRLSQDDWTRLLEPPTGQRLWWAFPPLALAARCYPQAIPPHVLERARAACPWILQRYYRHRAFSGVSMSNLWVEAFPGLEWAQSPGEALRYLYARLVPSREVLAHRQICAATQQWADKSRWVRASQLHRVLQWLFSHPPRAVTLSSVEAAWKHSAIQ